MRNNTTIHAALIASALDALSQFGNYLAQATGRSGNTYQKAPRPRKYQARKARSGVKSLDAKNYEKRYGLGFRYSIGSKPFSAQR